MAVHTGMWYVLVCTALYLHSTKWYKVAQDGTRWYKVVQTIVYGGAWRYKAVRELQAGTYWHVLILTIRSQSGYAALLLDSLLQFCPADSYYAEAALSWREPTRI
jgi:hypothetical protein